MARAMRRSIYQRPGRERAGGARVAAAGVDQRYHRRTRRGRSGRPASGEWAVDAGGDATEVFGGAAVIMDAMSERLLVRQ
jgi:hypothetical protein